MRALRASTIPGAPAAARSIERDALEYPLYVRRNTGALLSAARSSGFDLAVFTNTLALEDEYLFYRAKTKTLEHRRMPHVRPTRDALLRASPLSRPAYLEAAVADVFSNYSRQPLDAVLIADSHGTSDFALIPRVNADLSHVSFSELLASLAEVDTATPAWATLKGTTKLAFWRALDEATRDRDVRLRLVFRDSCASGVQSFRELAAIPGKVELVAHSGLGLLYPNSIDYASIFTSASLPGDWIARLEAGLSRDGVHVDGRLTLWRWALLSTLRAIPRGLFFLPLLLWAGWWVLLVVRQRRAGMRMQAPAASRDREGPR